MITNKEIQKIAGLARIKLNVKEENKFKKELSSILEYIDKLNKIDTENVEPLYQTIEISNALRPDRHRKDFEINEKLHKNLIGQAPHSQNGFIKVKSIINKK